MTQYVESTGVIDLAWGHPHPALLPVAELAASAASALAAYGSDALEYGHPAGPPQLIEFICARLAETDGRPPSPEQVAITAGASHGLDLVATHLIQPGGTVLCDQPTYHLALKILRDHLIHFEPVASDESGIDLEDLRRVISRLPRTRRKPMALYTIPTFQNPTGVSLSAERRAALCVVAQEHGITIVEDDAYRELAYDGPPPPSLWSIAEPGTVVRLGSFAKSVAPGLRVGFLTAPEPVLRRITDGGLIDSGGGSSHFAAVLLSEYAALGHYRQHVVKLRAAYRRRRDALIGGLREHLPAAAWSHPAGGYFVWLRLPHGVLVESLARTAPAHGVGFAPAPRFFSDPDRATQAARLSFSRYRPGQLVVAAERLAAAIRASAG